MQDEFSTIVTTILAPDVPDVPPPAVNGTAPAITPEEAWDGLDLPAQLAFILERVHHSRWFEDEYLQVLIAHCTSSIVWAQIKARFKQIGGNAFDLEQVAKEVRASLTQTRQAQAHRNGPVAPPVAIAFDLTRTKQVRVALCNVLYVLEQHPAWRGTLGFDELLGDVVLLARPPYLSASQAWTVRPVTEQDSRETANWLQRTYQLYGGSLLAGEALTTYGCRFPFHAIRQYLDGLTWDGSPRLDYWLKRYCHVPENRFTMAVASKTLLAAVARVYQPGCKVDTLTILEGEQGDLKSTVWNTLAGNAWFSDSLPDLHDKDAAQALCGKWFVEFAELAHFQRNEIETVKRFLSQKSDHYRPSYGRKAATFPRQNVFVGSTNDDHYFKDSTGNRRFWPVKVGGICDIASLERDRDQLWAEAVMRYRQGERWHLTPALETLARAEQAQRAELDDWEAGVLDYATAHAHLSSDKAMIYITTEALLRDYFQLDNKLHYTQANTKRLGGILRRNGWKPRLVRAEPKGKQFKAFTKPPDPPEPDHPGEAAEPETGFSGQNGRTGFSEFPSNDASKTGVTYVTGRARIEESNWNVSAPRPPSNIRSLGKPILPVLPVLPVSVEERRGDLLSPVSGVPVTPVLALAGACPCGGLWLARGDGRCTRCNGLRPLEVLP